MELFSYKVLFDSDNKPVPMEDIDAVKASDANYPSWNCNNFWDASLVVFITLANDGWSVIYFDFYRSASPIASTLFFVSLILVGQNILLQLFLTILLNEFDESSLVNEAKL